MHWQYTKRGTGVRVILPLGSGEHVGGADVVTVTGGLSCYICSMEFPYAQCIEKRGYESSPYIVTHICSTNAVHWSLHLLMLKLFHINTITSMPPTAYRTGRLI